MEDSLGGAPVALGIVEDSLHRAIRVQVRRRELIGAGRKRHGARQSGPVEHEGIRRQTGRATRTDVLQIRVQKLLNAGIGGAQPVAEQLILLIVVAQQGSGQFQKVGVRGAMAGRLPERHKFQLDVAEQF